MLKQSGLTRRGFASLSGISRSSVDRFFSPACNVSVRIFCKMAVALGCTLSLEPIGVK